MRLHRDDRGATSVELVIVAPLLIMFLLLIVGLGRMALARQDATAAAYEAARAASLERVITHADNQGRAAARRILNERGLSCADLSIHVDTSNYRPGGQVSADVTCVADLGDLLVSGLPGSKTYHAHATVPIEKFRAG